MGAVVGLRGRANRVAIDVELLDGGEEAIALAPPEAAFAEAIAEHRTRLFRLALLLTGDPTVADDVVADVCAKVFEKWQAGRVDNIGGYLHRAVVNDVAGRWRRRRVAEREQARKTVRVEAQSAEHGLAERAEMLDVLRTLPPRQRAVLVLRFYEDRSEGEIAELLGIKPGTVKSQQSKALEALRRSWPGHGGER